MRNYLITLLLSLGWMAIYAQSGDSYFENKDYYNAARYYEDEVANDPSKYFNLAKSYYALDQYEKSASAMEKYKDEYSDADILYARKFIELLRRDDDDIELRAITSVNSTNSEIIPVISKDGKRLYFSGEDRQGGVGGWDLYYADQNTDGTWATPVNFEVFNTKSHEGVMGVNSEQDVMILFGNYPGSFGDGDLFYSVKEDETWSFPCNLGGTVNTEHWESQASLSASGKYIVFVSDRPGGQGSYDLYVTSLSSEGWSTPINLKGINTTALEASPFLAGDDETLYFSSSGHFSVGGEDLFVSKRLDDSWENWSEPVNMGKGINTLNSDRYLAVPSTGTRGYIAAQNKFGTNENEDLYEFILPPRLRPETLINVKGIVTNEDAKGVPVIIRYFDQESGDELGLAVSSAEDGSYALSLPAFKKYDVIVDMKGYLYYDTELDLIDLSQYYPAKSFKEIVGTRFNDLKQSEGNFQGFTEDFGNYLALDRTGDMQQNFDDLLKLTTKYDLESETVRKLLQEAKYAYLLELEKQREVTQDHEVNEIQVGATFNVENLFFDFGKATLREESKQELDRLYDIMDKSEIVVEFGGHSDNVGTDETNLQLSQARVSSVKSYLVDKGIDSRRITAVGYGETQPIADNATEGGRQKNRRVELKITSLSLEREGQDEITGDESVTGVNADLGALAELKDEIDIKAMFREAALKGGLPAGSDCGKNIDDLYVSNDNTTYLGNRTNSGSKTRNRISAEKLDKSNYVFKGFNAHIQNYGFDNIDGTSWGVGARFMNDELREIYGNFYFANPDGIDGMANLGILYAVQLYDIFNIPINIHFGADALGFKPAQNDDPERPDPRWFLNIPVGLRYVHNINDIYIGPEVFYNINVLKSDAFTESPGYFSLGVNARWKLFHGGVFLNSGNVVNFLGVRAGVSF
ncbi:MAG: OmpA family protein [Bacteroidota bacterium]